MRKIAFLLLSTIVCSISFAQNDNWTITASEINPEQYYGVTAANGMVGLVTSPQPLKVKDVVLNGVFDTYSRGRVSNILKGFNFADLELDVRPEGIPTQTQRINLDNVEDMKQTIDMRYGIFKTSFTHRNMVEVKSEMMALRHLPFTSLITLEVKALQDVDIFPSSKIIAPDILRDPKQHFSIMDYPHVRIPLMTSVAKSPTGKHTLAACNSFIFEDKHDIPELLHQEWDYNMHFTRWKITLKAGESYTFHVVGSEVSTEHYSDPHNEAERLSVYAMLEGYDRLISRHKEAWDKLWESDIVVEGDDEAQKAIRFHLYHLYAFTRAGTAYSPSPMGLSGLGYNGHVFWDTELWMYPPLLVLHSDLAHSMLEYRYERLEMAKQNAFAHGYKGAMYPWESDDEGQEATPVWALTGPYEHHISGCVSFAAWQYYQVTQDREWLESRGWPLMEAVADFWVSRVEKDDEGLCHIRNVVGADEWAENIDDNAFTNGVAIKALENVVKAASILGKKVDPAWAETANCIPILKLDNGVTAEYDGYQDTTIKQADVNLLAYPLGVITDKKQIKKELDYYEERMSPTGPAMGNAVLSILHNRLGNAKKAAELFDKAYKPNEIEPFGVLAECPGCSNPYFSTGAGGFIQAVIMGFGGVDITDEGIRQIESSLPAHWKSLTIKGVGKDRETIVVR
jgi:trehalose/maltose hydrolase-like predicted phosphorylase